MGFLELNGKDAITNAMKLVEDFLKNPLKKVFLITGYFGIGKRTALNKKLKKLNITPVNHNYTIIEIKKPIENKLNKHPESLHIWDDVFRVNLMNEEVFSLFKDLENLTIPFLGKFILVANDQEFPD